MFRTQIRRMATSARQSLKIGLIPADGIGKEVIPAAKKEHAPRSALDVEGLGGAGRPSLFLGRAGKDLAR